MNFSPKFQRKLVLSLVVLLVALLLLVWKSCNDNRQLSAYKDQMTKFELGEQKFLTTINEKGEQINEQEQLILSQKDALAHKVLELENLKKVKSQVIVKTNTIIDSVFIPFDSSWQNENQFDTILVYDTINMENIIFVPKTFS